MLSLAKLNLKNLFQMRHMKNYFEKETAAPPEFYLNIIKNLGILVGVVAKKSRGYMMQVFTFISQQQNRLTYRANDK